MIAAHSRFLSHQDAATLNRNIVLTYIKNHAPISRTDLWKDLSLSRASVTQIIKQLQDSGYVYEIGTGESKVGRRPSYLSFNSKAGYIIAVDWHLKTLFLADLNAEILSSRALKLNNSSTPNAFVKEVVMNIKQTLASQNILVDDIIGVGLCMPGMVQPRTGSIIYSIDPRWENIPLADMIEAKIALPTYLEADGNALALGEYYSSTGNDCQDFVLFDVGESGIGISLILNGKLYRGNNHMVGEIGHIPFNGKIEGPKCLCGKNGCVEAYIMQAITEKADNWQEKIEAYVSYAVSVIINLLDPSRVVLCGSIVDKCDSSFAENVNRIVNEQIVQTDVRKVQIIRSDVGPYARVNGICNQVFSKTFRTTN